MDKTALFSTAKSLFSALHTKELEELFQKSRPNAVHIPIELGEGLATRHFCQKKSIPFTTAFHTNLAFGMKQWCGIPPHLTWRYLHWFHKPAKNVLVHSKRLQDLLKEHNFQSQFTIATPGVDPKLFYYDPSFKLSKKHKRPYFIYAGRVSKEKNIDAFLKLNLPGTKIVLGNGPAKPHLLKKYGNRALFFPSQDWRQILSMCDVFVLPSRFETFGLVQLEALACGLPIAAFPIMGPLDVIEEGVTGYALNNLEEAAIKCLSLKKEPCMEASKKFSWELTTERFIESQFFF